MTSTNKDRAAVLCLMLFFTALGIGLADAATEDNYKSDIQILPQISESTHIENGHKAIIVVNPTTTGIYAEENEYKIYLTINPQGIGGTFSESNYQLVLIPEKTLPELVIEYGFEVNFNVIDKTRIGRTIFRYTCTITMKNASSEAIENVELELVGVPDNMTIIDSNVTFDYIEAWGTVTSEDTCIFEVNRVEPIEPAEIIWQITYDIAATGEGMQQMSSSTVLLEPEGLVSGDITGEGIVDFEDLAELADQWLQPPGTPSADIAPLPVDGIVNFLDFAKLAENWMK